MAYRKRQTILSGCKKSLGKVFPQVMDVIVDAAVSGDISACQALLDRVYPKLRPVSQTIDLPPPDGPLSVTQCVDRIQDAMMASEISVSLATEALAALKTIHEIRDQAELIARIEDIERRFGDQGNS